MRRSFPGLDEESLRDHPCPHCCSPYHQIQHPRRNCSGIRRIKSTEILNANIEKVDVEISQGSQSRHQQPVKVIYQRNLNRSVSTISKSQSEDKLPRRSFGIRQRCHDSDKTRMPWSMANSHRNPQDFDIGCAQVAEGGKQDNRVFPFQSTPSGNLKVIPQQVVFESKKVSVLVADPKHTKVNIKAELAKQALASNRTQEDLAKTMESEESRNAKKHQILNAMALIRGEGRGVALHQMLSPGMPPMPMAPHLAKYQVPPQSNPTIDEGQFAVGEANDDHDDLASVESEDTPKPELNLVKLGFTTSAPIDWTKIKLPQKTNLYKHMHYRITNYVNPDCLVQIEDVQFNCHLLVLQCYSIYFNEKTSRDVVKLPSESVSPKAFELIYEWMTYVHGDSYTILKRDNILEVFLAAQFLGIKELEEQCWAFVDCEELFTEDTAFLLYLEAKKVGNTAIMELMIPRIMKFFLTLVSSKDFLDLKLDEIYVLLSSNYITVHSEIEVFMSAVRWLWHDWKTRKDCLEQVMSCVRFGLIAPWQLVDIRRNPENPEFLEITSHPSVQQMIDNGLAYAIIKYWYGNQTGDYYHWIDLLGLSEPPGRNWAGEEKNYVTYREFLHDLEQYRKELFYEKERLKSKQAAKSKRVSEQSGLTTSPRDILHQPERISSRKHSTASKNSRNGEIALTDPMRNEIIQEFVDNGRNSIHAVHLCTVAAPSSIWNVNNIPVDLGGKRRSQLDTVPEANRPESWSRIPRLQKQPDSRHVCDENELQITPDWKNESFRVFSTPSHSPIRADVKLQQEKAAIVIQRAFRRHLNRLVLRSRHRGYRPGCNQESRDRSSQPRQTGKTDKERNRSCAPVVFDRFSLTNNHLSNQRKDYLRDGSLYLADRELVMVFGGIDPHSKYGEGRNTGRNIFRYHAQKNQWDLVGELPQPRHHHAVVFFKSKVYLAGGADPRNDVNGRSVVVNTVWSFEPTTRSWFKESDMMTARKNFGFVVLNDKLLAVGGQDKDGKILSSVEKYDTATGVWEYVTPLTTGRTGAAVARYRDSVWVAGGLTASKTKALSSSVESYDAKRNMWVQEAPLRFPRCFSCLFPVNDCLYLIGGAGLVSDKDKTTSSCNSIDIWSWKEQQWKLHFAMSIPRHGHAVAYLGAQILIIGGVTTAYFRAVTDVECFCCERRAWVRGLTGLPVPLSGHGAITLPPASLM